MDVATTNNSWTQSALSTLADTYVNASEDSEPPSLPFLNGYLYTPPPSPTLPPISSLGAVDAQQTRHSPLPFDIGPTVLPIDEVAICAKVHGMIIPNIHETSEQQVTRIDHNLHRVADMASDILPNIQMKLDDLHSFMANALAAHDPIDITSILGEINIVRDTLQNFVGQANGRMDGLQVVLDAVVKLTKTLSTHPSNQPYSRGTNLRKTSPTYSLHRPDPHTKRTKTPTQGPYLSCSSAEANLQAPIHSSFHQIEPSFGPGRTMHEVSEVLVHHVSFIKRTPKEAANTLLHQIDNLSFRDIQSTGKAFGYPYSILSIRFKSSEAAHRFVAAFDSPTLKCHLSTFTAELYDGFSPKVFIPTLASLDDIKEPSTSV
ncbi:uncharacterized protein ARMOST_04519 [Armillaria ostoyae]|uniref:Uncharacterized protein n=1 Tax=Armillaria ostoyae TaxID=47428 RepID=A0A284QXJ4_ARMOS|nr:uncharacterized protein ARMOST_04519 [Armillaria ostoyae]